MPRPADRPDPVKRLTDLELEIMQVVWKAEGEPQTVRAVAERLQARGRPLAYTSVQTMLNILKKKGVLNSRPGPGRALEYRSRLTREQATQSMTQDSSQHSTAQRPTFSDSPARKSWASATTPSS